MEAAYERYKLELTQLSGEFETQSFEEFSSNYREFCDVMQTDDVLNQLSTDAERPDHNRVVIDFVKVQEYKANDFKIKEIAKLMGVKPRTLQRRIAEWGINMRTSYSTISDEKLDEYITAARKQFPNFGLQLIKGKLSSDGIKIQHCRLRESYNRVGLKQGYPCKNKIKRRVYSVQGPLSLWHLDGFHKFDGWGFVVHGIVDGYSKAIVGMEVADNNRSETVVKVLHRARLIWGMPACLRTDRGGENVLAADYLLQIRGSHNRSFIAGRSIHNQPIERQWKDTKERCLEPLLDEFHNMDTSGILHSESDIDLFCLHFVGMNLFQRTLDAYVSSWNHHPMRTKSYATPIQNYISGLALLKERQDAGEFLAPCTELIQDPDVVHLLEGIFDEDYLETIIGPLRAARNVPKYDCPLFPPELHELKKIIDATKVELDNIRNQFIVAKNFVIATINNRE